MIMTDNESVRSNKYSISLFLVVILRYRPAINIANPMSKIARDEKVQQKSSPQKDICLHLRHLSLVTTSSKILSLQI